MHSAPSPNEFDADEDQEPAVLSYTQFRNQLGLLEWRRRRAEYERRAAVSAALRQTLRPGHANAR